MTLESDPTSSAGTQYGNQRQDSLNKHHSDTSESNSISFSNESEETTLLHVPRSNTIRTTKVENPYLPSNKKELCRALSHQRFTPLQSNKVQHYTIESGPSQDRKTGHIGDRLLFIQPKTALQLLLANRDNNKHNSLYLLKRRHKMDRPIGSFSCFGEKYEDEVDVNNSHWLQLPIGGVHEIVGAAGTGKTQLCLNLCTQVTLSNVVSEPTVGIRAIYVSLKGFCFSSRAAQRLNQILEASIEDSDDSMKTRYLNQILVKGCANTDDLFGILNEDIPRIASDRRNTVRILILDSVADLFRGKLDAMSDSNRGNEAAERASMLFHLSSCLKQLSDSFHPLSVIIINQVTGCELSMKNATGHTVSKTDSTVPALGLSWAHCVNSSYVLTKTGCGTRKLTLLKSQLHQMDKAACFKIDSGGCFLSQNP